MIVPVQKPGKSRQDFATPPEFIGAVKNKLGIKQFQVDLAADVTNTKAKFYISEAQDSLFTRWELFEEWCWLNPPFAHIAPWAKKCSESGIKIAFLVPAAVGSNWFRDYVDGKALVLLLNGRICFDGKGPYPKDCVLCLYGAEPGYKVWDWRKDAPFLGEDTE